MVDSMGRIEASQMQEPEDDVTGVAAFELAVLVVSFVLAEAGLVRDAAFCKTVETERNKRGVIAKNLVVCYCRYAVLRLFDPGP